MLESITVSIIIIIIFFFGLRPAYCRGEDRVVLFLQRLLSKTKFT